MSCIYLLYKRIGEFGASMNVRFKYTQFGCQHVCTYTCVHVACVYMRVCACDMCVHTHVCM